MRAKFSQALKVSASKGTHGLARWVQAQQIVSLEMLLCNVQVLQTAAVRHHWQAGSTLRICA